MLFLIERPRSGPGHLKRRTVSRLGHRQVVGPRDLDEATAGALDAVPGDFAGGLYRFVALAPEGTERPEAVAAVLVLFRDRDPGVQRPFTLGAFRKPLERNQRHVSQQVGQLRVAFHRQGLAARRQCDPVGRLRLAGKRRPGERAGDPWRTAEPSSERASKRRPESSRTLIGPLGRLGFGQAAAVGHAQLLRAGRLDGIVGDALERGRLVVLLDGDLEAVRELLIGRPSVAQRLGLGFRPPTTDLRGGQGEYEPQPIAN